VTTTPDAPSVASLRIKVFADGAVLQAIADLVRDPLVQGLTTNPTLMRQAGVTQYESFARELVELVPDLPISFEVFSDDFDDMERQAQKIATWGDNVYVKIPVTNTRGEDAGPLVAALAAEGVKTNVTALMTVRQVETVAAHLLGGPPSYISVFAGRVADTGRDPVPLMAQAVEVLAPHRNIELIWASPRELLNIFQADAIGCHIITVTHDLLKKLGGVGRDLDDFSLATVKMFYDDATAAAFSL